MGFEFFILGMTAHDRLLPSFPLIRNAPRPLDDGSMPTVCCSDAASPTHYAHLTRQLHNLPVRTSVRPAAHEVLEP